MKNKEVKFKNENLYQYRKEKGISQEELGNIIGVSRQAVYKWEAGERMPDINNLIALCEVFDKKMEDFLEGADEYLKSQETVVYKNEKNNFKILKLIILIIVVSYLITAVFKVLIINIVIQKIGKYKDSNYYLYLEEDYYYNIESYTDNEDTVINNLKTTSTISYKDNWQRVESYNDNFKHSMVMWYHIDNKNPDNREIYSIESYDNEPKEYSYTIGFDYSSKSPYKLTYDNIKKFNNISFILNPFKIIKIDFEKKELVFEQNEYEKNLPTKSNAKSEIYIDMENGLLNRVDVYNYTNELKQRKIYYQYSFETDGNFTIEPSEKMKEEIKARASLE